MITTTLNKIRSCGPCAEGWAKLLKNLGKTVADDEPLPFAVIVKSNGLDDALWCCQSAPEYRKEWRLFAVWCYIQVRDAGRASAWASAQAVRAAQTKKFLAIVNGKK